jgi:cephalosporin hydroxylase
MPTRPAEIQPLRLANDPQTIAAMAHDEALRTRALDFMAAMVRYRYSYNFTWLGRPIIQFPPDVLALQELLWSVQPELVIETGVAHGGSLVLSASVLQCLGRGEVLGIDIEIRPHNRAAIEAHPLAARMRLLEGSSIDEGIVREARRAAARAARTLVILDSNHTHAHVLRELELYSPLVGKGSYLIVMDTLIEDLPADSYPGRPWGKGNNPKSAVREFLGRNRRFEVDRQLEARLLFSAAPEGYLRCIEDI